MKLPELAYRGHLDQCWLFVYRTPAETIAPLLPPQLEPVIHGGYAFWNIVVCQLSAMRPALLPAAIGLGYWHVAYRLHVRTRPEFGPPREGLFFVRSDCDRHLVAAVGNRLTDFHFHLAQIRIAASAELVEGKIESATARGHFQLDRKRSAQLSAGSPFGSLPEAARALEYQPAAFAPRGKDALDVVAIQRDSAAWRWRPVAVSAAEWQFLDPRATTLELCYEVEPLDYLWRKPQTLHKQPCTS